MDILYDHQIFATQSRGGISRYFFELADAMAGRSEVSVDLFAGLNITDLDLAALVAPNVHVTTVRRPCIPKTARAFGVLNAVLLRTGPGNRPHDIYHPTYFGVPPVVGGARVLTVYDMAHEKYAEIFPRQDHTAAQKRRAVVKADAIIAISEATKVDIMEILGVPEERIRVIHLANSLRQRTHLGPAVEGPYILFVGVRAGYKNFERLLRVYAKNVAINQAFRLVCFGGPALSKSEVGIIEASGLSNRVRRVSGDDVLLARMYEHAAAFVYPSLYEGFGLPPLEAMFFGCPVLASRITPILEVAGDAALYFEPEDEQDLSDKLEMILGSERVRETLRQSGFGREARYSWDRCATETLSLYRDVAGT